MSLSTLYLKRQLPTLPTLPSLGALRYRSNSTALFAPRALDFKTDNSEQNLPIHPESQAQMN